MQIPMLVVVAVVLIAFVCLNLFGGRSSTQRRDTAREVDFLLSRAESRMLTGEHAEAEVFFAEALRKSEKASLDFYTCEALYGLARIEYKRRNFVQAVQYLERAVELSANWKTQKPEFARLIAMELASARKAAGQSN